MGAAQRSAPPPGLKEICQDPIRLLSSAYNVWMTVPHKSNKAPRFHSAVKANVGGAFVVTQTIIWQFRHSRSNLCMALRLNWPFLKDEDDLNKSCSQTMSHTHQCQFLSLATNNEDFFSQFERVSGDAFRLFFFWFCFYWNYWNPRAEYLLRRAHACFQRWYLQDPAFSHYWFNTYITSFTSET